MFGTSFRPIFRRFCAAPGFTALALLTIAMGVGANATIFAVVENVLLKPLAFTDPERLVSIHFAAPPLKITSFPASPSAYFTYLDQSRTFSDVGLWTGDVFNLSGRAEPEQVPGIDITYTLPRLLGIHPILGRSFDAQDDLPGAPLTALVSFSYWQQKFGGDPHVIGQRVVLDDKPHEIIGVLPQRLHFFDQHPAFLVPLQLDRQKTHIGNFSYAGIARLKNGVTLAQATRDAQRMLAIQFRSFPAPPGFTLAQFEAARFTSRLQSLSKEVVGDIGATLWVLMGTIGLVLLIACANVANLLLVRVEGRQQELAVRAALGASQLRLSLDLLLESVLLGLSGGLLGLGLAFAALRALIVLAPANLPRLEEISIDGRVALFTIAISLGAGLLFGLIPVLRYASARIQPVLRQGGRNASASRERHRTRNGLVVIQVTLAVVLLITSGLMVRTIRALTQVNPGFTSPSTLQTLQITIPTIKSNEQVVRNQQTILEAISAIPSVSAAGVGIAVPMDGRESSDPVFAEDHAYGSAPEVFRYQFTAPGYFKALGAPLVAGRDYNWTDLYSHRPVAILSAGLASNLWGDPQRAIGKRVRQNLKAPWLEVIGVAPDLRSDGLSKPAPLTAYWPFLQDKDDVMRTVKLVVRSPRAGSQAFVNQLRHAIWSVNAAVPIMEVSTEQALVDRSLARTSFTLVLLSVSAIMALVLGIVGIYGVVAYSVSQRTREIGVRLAVGAQPGQVMALFLRSALGLTAAGLVCGILLASVATRLIAALLFGVNPVDLVTYATGSAALTAAALFASYLPTRRIVRIDPAAALRSE